MNNNNLAIALLGFLIQQPKHGYELHKDISDLKGIGIVWSVKMGKLYAMLHDLEKQGYVFLTVSQEGQRPPKNIYTISKPGASVFQEWLVNPVAHGRELRLEFLIKLYFAQAMDAERAYLLITRQIEKCQEWLKAIEQSSFYHESGEIFQQLVRGFRKSQVTGFLQWLENCQLMLGEKHK